MFRQFVSAHIYCAITCLFLHIMCVYVCMQIIINHQSSSINQTIFWPNHLRGASYKPSYDVLIIWGVPHTNHLMTYSSFEGCLIQTIFWPTHHLRGVSCKPSSDLLIIWGVTHTNHLLTYSSFEGWLIQTIFWRTHHLRGDSYKPSFSHVSRVSGIYLAASVPSSWMSFSVFNKPSSSG